MIILVMYNHTTCCSRVIHTQMDAMPASYKSENYRCGSYHNTKYARTQDLPVILYFFMMIVRDG